MDKNQQVALAELTIFCYICPQVKQKMEAGGIALHKFVITKQLTKRPIDYPDAQNQPHVQVALRRAKDNKRDGVNQVMT